MSGIDNNTLDSKGGSSLADRRAMNLERERLYACECFCCLFEHEKGRGTSVSWERDLKEVVDLEVGLCVSSFSFSDGCNSGGGVVLGSEGGSSSLLSFSFSLLSLSLLAERRERNLDENDFNLAKGEVD